jgi:hypothetical protein
VDIQDFPPHLVSVVIQLTADFQGLVDDLGILDSAVEVDFRVVLVLVDIQVNQGFRDIAGIADYLDTLVSVLRVPDRLVTAGSVEDRDIVGSVEDLDIVDTADFRRQVQGQADTLDSVVYLVILDTLDLLGTPGLVDIQDFQDHQVTPVSVQ